MQAPRRVAQDVAMGAYSPGVVAGGFCFVSGQGGIDFASRKKVEGGIKEETKQALGNVERILREAGYRPEEIVKVNVYLEDIDDWSSVDEVFESYFPPEHLPARTALAVKDLPADILVEIECMAWKHD